MKAGSNYKTVILQVYAVSDKRVSQPEVAPEVPEDIPELEEYPTAEEEENEFAENLIDFLQRYPQIVDLMDGKWTYTEISGRLGCDFKSDFEFQFIFLW